jgi:hypothetical protein
MCKPLFGWIKCYGKCNNVSYVHGIYNRFGGDLVQKWKHSFNDGAMLWRLTQTGLTHTRHPMNPPTVTIQGNIIKDRQILYLWGQMHDTVNMDLLQLFGWPWLGAALLLTCLFNSDCIKKRLTSCGIGDQWNQWCKSAFRSGASQVQILQQKDLDQSWKNKLWHYICTAPLQYNLDFVPPFELRPSEVSPTRWSWADNLAIQWIRGGERDL